MFDGFGVRFKQVRKEQKLTQAEMGQRIGISVPSVSRLEKCEIPSRTDVVLAMIEQFGCDPTWLLTGKPNPESDDKGGPGIPVVANLEKQDVVGRIRLPELSHGEQAVKVVGDDMMPTIRSGDYVVYVSEPPTTGDVVLFTNEWNEVRARRFREIDGGELVAEHPDFPMFKIGGQIKLVGKIVHVVRSIRI
jgi:transcriptional regulator with XRE-family HTH domain